MLRGKASDRSFSARNSVEQALLLSEAPTRARNATGLKGFGT
jgi:hypothetical protein